MLKNHENGVIQLINTTPQDISSQITESVIQKIFPVLSKFESTPKEEWLTRSEVADLLKVDLSTIHRWSVKGTLKKYGIGSKVRYRRSEVEKCVKPIKF